MSSITCISDALFNADRLNRAKGIKSKPTEVMRIISLNRKPFVIYFYFK
jgi:hypothetical protein